MKNMKNKRGQIFEGILLLAFVSICVYSLYAVYTFEKNVAQALYPPKELCGMYYQEDNFKIYGEEASTLLAHRAFSEVINRLGGKCQRLADGTPVWEDSCIPSTAEINSRFFEEMNNHFNESFSAYKDYRYKFIQESGNVKILFDEIITNASTKSYNASYSYTANFSALYPITEGPKAVLETINKRIGDCKQLAENDKTLDVFECAKKFTLKSWDSECLHENVYLKCSLSTKEYYFYNESYKPIEMNIAIKL